MHFKCNCLWVFILSVVVVVVVVVAATAAVVCQLIHRIFAVHFVTRRFWMIPFVSSEERT